MTEHKQTVLVVDDYEEFRTLSTIILCSAGFRVEVACNGAEALDYLRTHEAPAAIVLDISMPVLDGWGFLERQNKEAALAQIPVIVHSCVHPYTSYGRRYRNIAGVLQKPTDIKVFVETVRRAAQLH